jgi:transposase
VGAYDSTLPAPRQHPKYMYMHECIDLSECIRVRVAKWLLNLAADPLDAATAAHILEYTCSQHTQTPATSASMDVCVGRGF